MNISNKVKSILTAAVNTNNINDIATELGLSVQSVSGSLASIKKENFATYTDKKLVLTTEGLAVIGVTLKKKKNKEVVASLVHNNPSLTKVDLVKLIASTLGKTIVDSRVYFYNYEKAAGLRVVGQQ